MKRYHNILCPTNFSDYCNLAIERAMDLAEQYGASLTLLHVIDYFPEEIPNDMIGPEDEDPKKYLERRAGETLHQLAASLGLKDIRLETRFSSRSAKHEISHFAEEISADLIVLASHAQHGITALLGSTAGGVIHIAPCDVLVVRAGQ